MYKKPPLVYVISVLMLLATAVRGLLQAFDINDPNRWVIVGLIALYGFLLFSDIAIIRRPPIYLKLYFVIQSGIIVNLLLLPDYSSNSNDFMALLFIPLCVQAVFYFPKPANYYWIIAITVANSIALHKKYGLTDGIQFSIMYMLGFSMVSFLAIFYLNAEEAKEDLYKAHKQLQEYSKNAEALAVAEERNRLARDLHDSVTQSLYSLMLFAEAAKEELSAGRMETVEEHLSDLSETSQQALQEMRMMVFELRPAELETKGLVLALQERLEAVETRSGIEPVINFEFRDRLPLDIETGFYNIAREAMNNILKHAQATQVNVELRKRSEKVVLEINDNGAGLKENENLGLGIKGMRERANQIGAELIIEPNQDGGTRVRVEVSDVGSN
ncbi:MAG: hypothetical protein GWN62_19320 [Aliifodinibius sp.]|nr:hypothetical protein [Fodinibius sp.]